MREAACCPMCVAGAVTGEQAGERQGSTYWAKGAKSISREDPRSAVQKGGPPSDINASDRGSRSAEEGGGTSVDDPKNPRKKDNTQPRVDGNGESWGGEEVRKQEESRQQEGIGPTAPHVKEG